jgi:hypothetical protein
MAETHLHVRQLALDGPQHSVCNIWRCPSAILVCSARMSTLVDWGSPASGGLPPIVGQTFLQVRVHSLRDKVNFCLFASFGQCVMRWRKDATQEVGHRSIPTSTNCLQFGPTKRVVAWECAGPHGKLFVCAHQMVSKCFVFGEQCPFRFRVMGQFSWVLVNIWTCNVCFFGLQVVCGLIWAGFAFANCYAFSCVM